MVSSAHPSYRAELVRLVHGDDNPDGPGLKMEVVPSALDGEYAGRVQQLRTGSYARMPPLELGSELELDVWVCPTTPGRGEQAILAHGDLALVLDADGAPGLRLGDEIVSTGVPLLAWEWYHVKASFGSGGARITQLPARAFALAGRADVQRALDARSAPTQAAVTIGARVDGSRAWAHFNGRIEEPRISSAGVVVAHWDLSRDIPTRRVSDVSGNGHDGELVNLPMRAVTGRRWRGTGSPGWMLRRSTARSTSTTTTWRTPVGSPTSASRSRRTYRAASTRRASERGGDEEYLPFLVRPPRGRATADVALPRSDAQLSGLRERALFVVARLHKWAPGNVLERLTERDRYMQEHRLLSLYDFHSDGTGTCYSSFRRPLLSLRPGYDMPLISAPHQFNADLHLLDWLEAEGLRRATSSPTTTCTTKAPRSCAATASWSPGAPGVLDRADARRAPGLPRRRRATHVPRRQRLLLGDVDPSRRAARDRVPARAVGLATVEFAARRGLPRRHGRVRRPVARTGAARRSGSSASASPRRASDASRPYRRLPDSFDARAAWIFEGVGDDEPIGDFGLVMGGAGGRRDRPRRPGAGHAAARARRSRAPTATPTCTPAQMDDTLFHQLTEGGSDEPARPRRHGLLRDAERRSGVRPGLDLVVRQPLARNGYENNVSRITENVLRRFLDPAPFPPPG